MRTSSYKNMFRLICYGLNHIQSTRACTAIFVCEISILLFGQEQTVLSFFICPLQEAERQRKKDDADKMLQDREKEAFNMAERAKTKILEAERRREEEVLSFFRCNSYTSVLVL